MSSVPYQLHGPLPQAQKLSGYAQNMGYRQLAPQTRGKMSKGAVSPGLADSGMMSSNYSQQSTSIPMDSSYLTHSYQQGSSSMGSYRPTMPQQVVSGGYYAQATQNVSMGQSNQQASPLPSQYGPSQSSVVSNNQTVTSNGSNNNNNNSNNNTSNSNSNINSNSNSNEQMENSAINNGATLPCIDSVGESNKLGIVNTESSKSKEASNGTATSISTTTSSSNSVNKMSSTNNNNNNNNNNDNVNVNQGVVKIEEESSGNCIDNENDNTIIPKQKRIKQDDEVEANRDQSKIEGGSCNIKSEDDSWNNSNCNSNTGLLETRSTRDGSVDDKRTENKMSDNVSKVNSGMQQMAANSKSSMTGPSLNLSNYNNASNYSQVTGSNSNINYGMMGSGGYENEEQYGSSRMVSSSSSLVSPSTSCTTISSGYGQNVNNKTNMFGQGGSDTQSGGYFGSQNFEYSQESHHQMEGSVSMYGGHQSGGNMGPGGGGGGGSSGGGGGGGGGVGGVGYQGPSNVYNSGPQGTSQSHQMMSNVRMSVPQSMHQAGMNQNNGSGHHSVSRNLMGQNQYGPGMGGNAPFQSGYGASGEVNYRGNEMGGYQVGIN